MLRSTVLSVHRILIAVFIRSASADSRRYGDTKTKTDATAIVSSGQLTTDYRLSIRPPIRSDGRMIGRTADGQTNGRTDWTDGQAAASTALSTPPVANAVYIGFPAWCKNAFNGF
ncbi:GM25361 [Drosophila sechellia]|uniref:GM25361 n=1 Tax=Drosophila sechellia TaxID=7238 RepID=B4HG47_DROSE|nr:GM25361 [Drosophila sechellia]